MIAALIAAAAFAQATPAAAPAPAAAPTPAAQTAPATAPTPPTAPHVVQGVAVVKSQDKLICHNEVEIGSRFAKKVCATKSERDQAKQDARDQVDKMQALRPYTSN